MTLRIFDIRFNISVPFAVMLCFLLFMDSTGFMSASLLAVVLHEAGHIAAMKLTKCAPRSISCSLGGLNIVGRSFTSFKESAFIAVSGPLVNICFAIIFWIASAVLDSITLSAFSVVQLLVGVVNLLPIKGLDGGTLLSLVLNKFLPKASGVAASLVSIVTACIIFVAGLAVAVKNVSNPSLLLLGIYLIIINVYRCNLKL